MASIIDTRIDTRPHTGAPAGEVSDRPAARGRDARPRVLSAPVGKPKASPAPPIVRGATRHAGEVRLTNRGIAVIMAILLVQFVLAVVVITSSFLSVSDEPLPEVPVAAAGVDGVDGP